MLSGKQCLSSRPVSEEITAIDEQQQKMPTGHAGQNHETGSGIPSEKTAWAGRRRLATTLSLMAATIAVSFAITPLRESLQWSHISPQKAQRLEADLETALDQVYRSFELDDEAATYDRIAKCVTGDATRDIYLDVRRSLLDEDGGRVLIDEVRLDKVDQIQWHTEGGCEVDATWVVRGTVGHFGHYHERQNRYRARIKLLSQADSWKIGSVQIVEHERER